ncbi:SigE family RNA polymerase sigma factor [Streptomyces sp. I05A-00742]|uniref:SigE family RNA polymerase sigma factor n=1 Tax=Streptomyces sp. I05A-00742 TaxID=2732853 RepID=UPI0014893944
MAEVISIATVPRRGSAAARPRTRGTGGMPVMSPWSSVPGAASASAPAAPSAPSDSASAQAPDRIPAQSTGTQAPVTALPPSAQSANHQEAQQALPSSADATMAAGTTVDHLTETYRAHYRSLLGLAALLLDDTASCEDVVQEAFIRVHSARNRVRDPDKTLAYLRQTVVNLSRSALRRRILGLKLLSKPMPDMASAEEGAYEQLERDQLIKAMRGLQRRQREVLVLRYFADMTEAQVAEVLGLSLGSVKAYGSRGIAALRVAMEAPA